MLEKTPLARFNNTHKKRTPELPFKEALKSLGMPRRGSYFAKADSMTVDRRNSICKL